MLTSSAVCAFVLADVLFSYLTSHNYDFQCVDLQFKLDSCLPHQLELTDHSAHFYRPQLRQDPQRSSQAQHSHGYAARYASLHSPRPFLTAVDLLQPPDFYVCAAVCRGVDVRDCAKRRVNCSF